MMTDQRRRPRPADLYRQLWTAAQPPILQDFIAAQDNLSFDDLLDIIETDQTERWKRGERIKAERYFRLFPGLHSDPEAALVIIYGEYFIRRELGEAPSLTEYLTRFPEYARRLRDQVHWHEAIELASHDPAARQPPRLPDLEIHELLGRGGMCSVYRSTDRQGRTVAVKLLDRDHLLHPTRVARFRREADAMMRLHHPHIVTALATGSAEGFPYLIMEFCAGGTLATRLAARPIDPEQAAAVLLALAEAVQYAHDQGIIHRDLKPANVLLASPTSQADTEPAASASRLDGLIPKISDFGLAKCAASIESAITATKETLGTPCYMAPELTTGARDADERTDVYGLGAILYELLTGQPPFVAPTPVEVVRLVRAECPKPPSLLNPATPPDLEAACLRCLAKEPGERFRSARELMAALQSTTDRQPG